MILIITINTSNITISKVKLISNTTHNIAIGGDNADNGGGDGGKTGQDAVGKAREEGGGVMDDDVKQWENHCNHHHTLHMPHYKPAKVTLSA